MFKRSISVRICPKVVAERIDAIREGDDRPGFDPLEDIINRQFQRVVERGPRAGFQKPQSLLDLHVFGGQVFQQLDLLAELNDGDAISRTELVEETERGAAHQFDL